MADKQKALVLDLPGAPLSAHTVTVDAGEDGAWVLPGHFHPAIATPLGELGEPTLEQAKAAVKAGAHVKLVDVTEKQAEDARKWQREVQALAKNVVRDAQRSGDAATVARASVERQT